MGWEPWDTYLGLDDLMLLIPLPVRPQVEKLAETYREHIATAAGSSHNHQAWPGGYLDHVVETMNIAVWLYLTCPRTLPFTIGDACLVMFLHDLEKPWKHAGSSGLPDPACEKCGGRGEVSVGGGWAGYPDESCACTGLRTKAQRRDFRDRMIRQYDIVLTDEQKNALRYVEGVPDDEYTPGERTMGELAAFCHCSDILSARLWHDKGKERKW